MAEEKHMTLHERMHRCDKCNQYFDMTEPGCICTDDVKLCKDCAEDVLECDCKDCC